MPPAMVASSQRKAWARFPCWEWWTARTMVRLLVSRQKVITVETTIDGKKWNGVGQSWLAWRKYA